MRTLSGAELTVLAAAVYRVTPRIKVENGSGTMVDMTAWMERAAWGQDIDAPVAGATLEFRRDFGSLSLAPFRSDSILNRDDLGDPATLLDVGRRMSIEVATTALGSVPIESDYKPLFTGYQDVINWEHSPISVSCRDLGAVLVDAWLESPRVYGSTAGSPLQTVMAQMLNVGLGSGVVPLYTPVDPLYNISPPYTQQPMSVMQAEQELAQLRGWMARYKWDDGTSTERFTLFDPDRTKTVPDYTWSPSRYLDIRSLFIDRTNIRNAIGVSFFEASSQSRKTLPFVDATSIARYGRKYFLIQEGDDSPINSASEATTMGDSALADLKDPKADHEIETLFFWPVELGDLLRHEANGVHYNSDQDYAVVSFQHELTKDTHRTTIQTRGTPAGGYFSWRGRTPGTTIPQPESANALHNFRVIAETDTTITYGWTMGGLATEVWMAEKLFTVPLPADPWADILALLAPLPDGTLSYTFNKPGEGEQRLIQVEPRDADLTPGKVWRVVLNEAPVQAPLIETDDSETDTVGTQWWKYTERGIAVIGVEVQTQIGTAPVSAFGPPTRGPGDASVVRGGILGAGEYEHDVILDPTRFSWIVPRLTLETFGEPPIILGPFGFDRDKRPNLLQVDLSDTVLRILADSDTKSLRVYDKLGTWEYELDGLSATIDVALTGTNGVAGLGSSSTSTFTVEARSDPSVDVDVDTLLDTRDIVISGGTATPPSATWDTPGVQLQGPASLADDQVRITLKATSSPVGYTVMLTATWGPGFGDVTDDITADVSPALSSPPSVNTTYTFATGWDRATPGLGTQLITMHLQADLLDGSSAVVDSKTVETSWYSNS